MIYENLSIYNFYLTAEEEALVLTQFTDNKHELFPYLVSNFSLFPEHRAYIEERVVIRSTKNVFENSNIKASNQLVCWYKPNDLEDLVNIINNNRFTNRCIVVPKMRI